MSGINVLSFGTAPLLAFNAGSSEDELSSSADEAVQQGGQDDAPLQLATKTKGGRGKKGKAGKGRKAKSKTTGKTGGKSSNKNAKAGIKRKNVGLEDDGALVLSSGSSTEDGVCVDHTGMSSVARNKKKKPNTSAAATATATATAASAGNQLAVSGSSSSEDEGVEGIPGRAVAFNPELQRLKDFRRQMKSVASISRAVPTPVNLLVGDEEEEGEIETAPNHFGKPSASIPTRTHTRTHTHTHTHTCTYPHTHTPTRAYC